MSKQTFTTLILSVFVACNFISCTYQCNCDKYYGCKIMTARLKSNDSLVATKTFYSQTNFYTDKALSDSVQAFNNRYYLQGSTNINEKDSIINYDKVQVQGGQEQPYVKGGYQCVCPK